jgi:tRNA A-37 threonylcarbamoyl transferase component Bud32
MRTDPLLGRLIDGKYQIDAEIGAGGMATIYRATRLHIGDVVAVKVLHSELLRDPQFGERFRREAQAAARLKHPNVVAIYDFGVSTDGVIYLVMELVGGANLRSIIKESGPMSAGLAAEIIRQVCAALSEAHRQNIVHRDIKPANIAVETTADGLRVNVLDFGIVSLRGGDAATIFTQTGAVLGTPAYMSPEQCLGEELDGRSDIYSLGVVLFEMLCGVAPFNSPTPTAVAIQHVQQQPPPLRVLNASISPAVEDVVLRALAKRREDRFRSAREFADALTAAIGGSRLPFTAETVARPALSPRLEPTLVQSALQPPPRRAHPRGAIPVGIAIGAAALTIGALWVGVRQMQATPPRRASVAAESTRPRTAAPRPRAEAARPVLDDPRPLLAVEQTMFLQQICGSHYVANGVTHCVDRIGYTVPSGRDDDLRLTAILYGPLTRDAAHQAYVTYQSGWEPHATNFGGGILFDVGPTGWRLSKWYPGGQMDHCLVLPDTGRERLLCWSAYAGMGMFAQMVMVRHVPPSPADQKVFEGNDSRGAIGNRMCENGASSTNAPLWLYVDPPYHSHSGAFAEATAKYATPDDLKAACSQNDLQHLRIQKKIVRFVLNGDAVSVVE